MNDTKNPSRKDELPRGYGGRLLMRVTGFLGFLIAAGYFICKPASEYAEHIHLDSLQVDTAHMIRTNTMDTTYIKRADTASFHPQP